MRTKDLREKTWKQLCKIYIDINAELSRFRSVSGLGGEALITLPVGKSGRGTDWGRVKRLKRDKARILTIMNEKSWPRP